MGQTLNQQLSAEHRHQNYLNSRKKGNNYKHSKSTKTTSYVNLASPKATLTFVCLPTLVRLHVDQRQLICERDVRLGMTFDLVMQHDLVVPPWVASCLATDLCV